MIEVEKCPGHMAWSAFGAPYMDTACSSALDWSEAGYTPVAELCDADDDFRPRGIPCPFCDPEGFIEYQWGDRAEYAVHWADGSDAGYPEIHFHDGEALWWSATHPERGEEPVTIRSVVFDD